MFGDLDGDLEWYGSFNAQFIFNCINQFISMSEFRTMLNKWQLEFWNELFSDPFNIKMRIVTQTIW